MLRQKAEDVLKERQSQLNLVRSESNMLRLVHELEVHQIELEMQNDELLLANEQAELATAKYVELYEFAPSGYFILSREGKIIQVNIAGCQIFGIERSYLKNHTFGFFVSSESRPVLQLFLSRVFSSNTKETCDLSLTCPDTRHIHITGYAEQDKDECFVTAVDITEQKRVEKKLILANEELALQNEEKTKRAAELVDANTLIYAQHDRLTEIASLVPGVVFQYCLRPDGSSFFPYASEAIKQIYRVTPEEVREDASKVFLTLHPDDYDGVVISIQESAKNLSLWQHEYRVKFNDGSVRSLYGNAMPQAEADGSVLWHGFITDITERRDAENEFRESEQRFRNLAEHSRVITWECDSKGLYTYISHVCTEVLGYQPETIIGKKHFYDLHPKEGREEFKTAVFEVFSRKESISDFENSIVTFDNKIVFVSTNGMPILDPQGNLIGYRGSDMDITLRKHSEAEIIYQLALINSLLDSIPDLIFFKDIEGAYIGCNPTFANFVGKSRSEIVGKTDYDLFEKAEADSFRKFDKEMLVQKLPRHNEEWVTYADGSKIFLDTLKTPYWGGDGSLIGILGISRDITERNNAEEKLKQLSARLTLATRSGGVGVWDYDIVNDILVWDDQMFALYGIQRASFTGVYQAWRAGLHPADIDRGDTDFQMAIRGEKEFDTEFRVIWPDGSVHNIKAFAFVQRDILGEPMRMIGTNWDITSQKQREQEIKLKNKELQKVNTEKDKFFSIIAHDLRGPLGGFMGLTELMSDESMEFTENEKKEMALNLRHSARNTFNLLENLLEWSQMDRGLTEFKPQKLDLMALVTECLNIVSESARKKRIELIVTIPIHTEVFADKNMVQTVIRNLLSNAIKYTTTGGQVTISAKPVENSRVLISVKDTGIGMSEKMSYELFDIGANTKRPGTEGEKSTGLGLLLCKEFVEKHDGKITVESEQNQGTVFSFSIPSTGQSGSEIGVAKVELTEKVAGKINNLKIIIAEDDDISTKLIHMMVKGFSLEVYLAKTGNEAVEICRNNPDIDLILMDIAMPGMDGYEATRQIRQFNKEVVIIAQTTFAISADRGKAFEVGFNDYIPKPFGKEPLIELIKKHIN